jgi:glutamate/tyrosine decarboxylase-like PLP-dependent enzyme
MNGQGALAQLGERLHGMQEVSGSIPLGSTIHLMVSLYAARWLTRFRPLAFFA